MTYFCKLCDKSRKSKSKYNHFKSITQKTLDKSIIKKYIILISNFDQVDELMRKFIKI